MPPDQLPPGLRVKALEWSDSWFGSSAGLQLYSTGKHINESGFWARSRHCYPMRTSEFATLEEAKAACQRHHELQVCAQLEIVNG